MKKELTEAYYVTLTNKQKWFYDELKRLSTYKGIEWWSPTHLGMSYANRFNLKSTYASPLSSPTLIHLTQLGLLVRNNKGHYKFKPFDCI